MYTYIHTHIHTDEEPSKHRVGRWTDGHVIVVCGDRCDMDAYLRAVLRELHSFGGNKIVCLVDRVGAGWGGSVQVSQI